MNALLKYTTLTAVFCAAIIVPNAVSAQSFSNNELDRIEDLMEQIEKLKEQLADLRGEVKDILSDNIGEGTTSEDIRKIQELLSTDPSIYPRGLVTGYFGPLTKDAIKRFQERHGLDVTGKIDEETKEYLEELLGERQNGRLMPGLLRMPDIRKKIEDRIKDRCDKEERGERKLCKRLKDRDGSDDNSDRDLKIVAAVRNGTAYVVVRYENGSVDHFTFDETDEDDIIDLIEDETDLSKDEIEDAITFNGTRKDDDEDEDEDEDIESIEVEFDGENARVTVEFEDGDEDRFIIKNVDEDEDEVIEHLADRYDMDEDDIEDLVEFDY